MFPKVSALEILGLKLTFISWNHLHTMTRKGCNIKQKKGGRERDSGQRTREAR